MSEFQSFSRREFISTILAGLAAGSGYIAKGQEPSSSGIPTRLLGKTGERVSIVGLGGYTIGRADKDQAVPMMHHAIESGMTFFDNCWNYNQGWSEEVMGNALALGSKRDKVFLMTKCCGRDAIDAKEQLEGSLRRLQTDRIDLWMFHGISHEEEIPRIFAEKGAIHAALEARKEGKIRYIGFTGHRSPDTHLKVLAEAKKFDSDFDFDAVMLPINVLDAHYKSFQKKVLPVLNEREIGSLVIKSLAAGRLPKNLNFDAKLCRRFALSMPVSSVMCGIVNWDNLHQDISVAQNFKPLESEEVDKLVAMAEIPAAEGVSERYKIDAAGCDWQRNEDKKKAPA